MDRRLEEHLIGFEDRRKEQDKFKLNTERYHRENTKRLDRIETHQREREAAANANHAEIQKILQNQNRMLEGIAADAEETKIQAKYTNGRVSKLERNMLIVGTAVAVTIILKYPELMAFLKLV